MNGTDSKNEIKNKLVSALQGYLRQRMDYIASIPTMDPIWSAPLDVVCDIIEPIVGKEKIEREKDSNPMEIASFPKLFLLLNNIIRSENITAKSIEFEVKVIDENNTFRFHYGFNNKRSKYNAPDFSCESSYEPHKAAIYLGIVGCQAFYSIIENVLKNTARHSKKEKLAEVQKGEEKGKLKITIEFYYDWDGDFKKYKDDYIKVKIYDNLGGWEKIKENEKEVWIKKDEKKSAGGERNKEKIKGIRLEDIAKKLNPADEEGRIIDDVGKIIQRAWGLKEMRISASFLRGLTIENYEMVHTPPVIKPIIIPQKNEGSLGYEFYLPNVKDLLVISKDIYNQCSVKIEELKKQGIYIEKDIKTVVELIQKGTFIHEFVLIDFDDEETRKFYSENWKLFPYKTLALVSDNKKDGIPEKLKESGLIISKNEFQNWLKQKNNDKFEISGIKLNNIKVEERIILEVRNRWIEALTKNNLKKVGIYFVRAGKAARDDNLRFSLQQGQTSDDIITGNILLVHKFDDLSNLKLKNPLCMIPFTHSSSHSIWNIAEKLITTHSHSFDTLKAYFDALEVGLTNIVIVDERAYDDASKIKPLFRDINFAYYWYLQNTVIFNLDKENNQFLLYGYKVNSQGELDPSPQPKELKGDSEIQSKLSSLLPKWFNNRVHFLIIHQTIIDPKIGGEDEFRKFIDLLPTEYKPWFIIVTSGRGHPPEKDMPENSKFLDFSNLRKVLIDEPNKFLLIKILTSLKEKK